MRPVSIVALVFVLIVSQLTISANVPEEELPHEAMLTAVIDSKQSNVVIESPTKPYTARVALTLNFIDSEWIKIKEEFNPLVFNVPNEVTLVHVEDPVHTDKDLKAETLQDLTQIKVKEETNGFSLDFKDVDVNPQSFKVVYEILINEDLKMVDGQKYPAIGSILDQLRTEIDSLESQTDYVNDEDEKTPPNEVSDPKEDKIDENVPVSNETKPVLTGEIELNLKGEPHAKLRYKSQLISEKNPVKMDSYTNESKDFSVDIFTDDKEFVEISYKVKLDQDSLDKITADSTIFDFHYLENGERAIYKYEHDFPEEITLFTATQEQFIISDKLEEYSTSKFVRKNPTSNDGTFKLIVDELLISNEEAGIEDQYRFQNLISYKINSYISDEIMKGTDLDTIKESLKEGFEFATDEYMFNQYSFKQMDKLELDKLENYPLVINDFIASGNKIEETFPVQPIGGSDHKLQEAGFSEISGGLELKWEGILNSSRNHTMNNLNLAFTIPQIVKTSGLENWDVKTKVDISYFNVKNDGTLEPCNQYPSVSEEFKNTSTQGIEAIEIPLVEKNIVVKYFVTQTYINDNLQLEIEGNQLGRLTASLDNKQLLRSADNKKVYPNSIIIKGEKREEAMPTSLIWDIRYNNNELVRKENDGFNFRINKDTIKAYRADQEDKYIEIPATYDTMKFKHSIIVDGKPIDEDGRFDVVWNDEGTEAQFRLKSKETLSEPVMFSIILENEINKEYQPGKTIRDELVDSPSLKFEGDAEAKSFTNGQEITGSEPTETELKEHQATNYLVLLDKKPVMIDYRTKEVIWGASINTTTAHRIGLPGLSYIDKFGEGLEFEPMDREHKLLLFKIDPVENSYREYEQFRHEVQKLMDDSKLESEDIFTAVTELLEKPLVEEGESDKTYGQVAQLLDDTLVGYASLEDKESLSTKEYIVSRPKADPTYVDKIEGIVLNGDGNDEHHSDPTKNDLTKDADIRVDFVDSDKAVGSGGGDDNTYFILYKTKLHSDKPMDNISNLGQLIFASWVPGEGNMITWKRGGHVSKQDLGEVAKYNTIPKKEGVVKVVKDNELKRDRLAVEWTVNFNYDIDHRRIDRVQMDVKDRIDKKLVSPNQADLQNAQLKLEEIEKLEFKAFAVDKEGNITEAKDDDGKPIIKEAIVGEDVKITEDEQYISYHINKEMNPKYIYQFKLITFIDTDAAPSQTISDKNSKVSMSGNFTNHVAYDRAIIPDGSLQSNVGEAEANVTFDEKVRVKKEGIHDPQSGFRQQIKWTLTLNETYEAMSGLKITDTLEKYHTFAFVDNDNELGKLNEGKATLTNFKYEKFESGRWITVKPQNYNFKLVNLSGADDLLDDWNTGESGFILSFSEEITVPIRISYATFGQVVSDTELPLKNLAKIEYQTGAKAIEHNVEAEVSFNINDSGTSYDNERMDLGLSLRYNDNQQTDPKDLDAGTPINNGEIEKAIIILYRYQSGLPDNHHIYRIGRPNSDGYLEFKDLESGNYIIKQYGTAKGYSVPNSLGFVSSNRNKDKDHSVIIAKNELESGKLVNINLEKKTNLLSLLRNDTQVEKQDFAIYNTTPVFEVKNEAITTNDQFKPKEDPFANINMTVTDSSNHKQTFKSDDSGVFKVGTVNGEGERIDFGKYALSQPEQPLKGFIHNTETVEHEINSNPNGTVDATSKVAKYQNYNAVAILNVVKRGTTDPIENSSFNLYKKDDDGKWIAYDTIYSGTKNNDVYEVKNGTATFYNLETGAYKLEQVSVDGHYLLNTKALEFFAYGPEVLTMSQEGKPEPMEIQFDNASMQVNIFNKIEDTLIEGSKFKLVKENVEVGTFTITDKDAGYSLPLGPGSYSLTQIATTQNRPLNKKSQTFTIVENEEDETKMELVFMNHLGSIDIQSHGTDGSSIDIEHVVIQGPEGALTVGQRGGLYSGKYEVEEIKLNEAWIYVDTEPKFIIPGEYDEPTELDQVVSIYGTQAELIYANSDGDDQTVGLLTDGEFSLTNTANQSVIMNSNQTFKHVRPGTYDFQQTKAPAGYGLNTEIHETITVPETVNADEVKIDPIKHTVEPWVYDLKDFKNYRGMVSLVKTSGEDATVLEGVEFDLYQDNKLLIEGLKTNALGEINVGALAPGSYYFIETKGDGNHTISDQHYSFTIASENKGVYPIQEVGVKNYYANAVFKNTDPALLETYTTGHFSLFEKTDSGWVAYPEYTDFTIETGKSLFEIKGIKPGEYKLLQTQAPDQTIRNTFEYEFEIPTFKPSTEAERVNITLDDYINYQGSLEIAFEDENGSYKKDVAGTYGDLQTPVVGKDGSLVLTHLSPGNHVLTFTKAEDAIVYDENISEVIPSEAMNDEKIDIKAIVRVVYGRLEVNLEDGDSHEPLDSGSYHLNEVKYDVNSKGMLQVNDLGPGSYTLSQIKAADDYILNLENNVAFSLPNTVHELENAQINNMGTFPYVVLDSLTHVNYQARVVIHKTDDQHVPLEGVTFTMMKNDQANTVKTNADGIAMISHISPGSYILEETETLEGYQLVTDTIDIIVPSSFAGKPNDFEFKVINNRIEVLPPAGIGSTRLMTVGGVIALGLGLIVFTTHRRNLKDKNDVRS